MAMPLARRGTGLAQVCLVLLLLLAASSFPTRWDSESFAVNTSAGYYATLKVLQVVLAPICLFVFAQRNVALLRRLAAGWPWLLLAGWCALSTLWSVEKKTTVLGSVLILIISITTAFVSLDLDEARTSRIVAWYMTVLCGISIVLAIVAPQYGLMTSAKFAGLLRGVYSHKNLLGDVVSILLVWVLCAWFAGIMDRWLAIVSIGLGMLTVAWTFSTTSILMVLICIALLLAFRSAQILRMSSVTLTILIVGFTVLACIVVPLASDAIFGYFGKDASFTGRDNIWRAYLDLAATRPLNGYGFHAIAASTEYGISIRFANGGRPSPHNSFIQMYVDLGLPAVIFYLLAVVGLIASGVRRLGRGDRLGLFLIVFPVAYVINSLMEVTGGINNAAGYVFLLYMSMRPAPSMVRARTPRAAPAEPGDDEAFQIAGFLNPQGRPSAGRG